MVKDFLTKPSFAAFNWGLAVEPEVGFPGAGQFDTISLPIQLSGRLVVQPETDPLSLIVL